MSSHSKEKPIQNTAAQAAKQQEDTRLAAALRENLKRRKVRLAASSESPQDE